MIHDDEMNRAVDALRLQVRELDRAYVVHTDAVAEAVRVANIAIDVLDGELRGYVNTNGGPHGSPERAWEVWVDLALDTEQNLQRAAGYASSYSLAGWLRRGLETATDAATNFVKGAAGAGSLVVAVLGLLVVLELLKARRR